MSKCSDLEVAKSVLGAVIVYRPHDLMVQFENDPKFVKLKKQCKGQENFKQKLWIAIVVEVYLLHATPIAPDQAEGILTQFLSGHCASVQLLTEAGLVAYEEDEVDSSG